MVEFVVFGAFVVVRRAVVRKSAMRGAIVRRSMGRSVMGRRPVRRALVKWRRTRRRRRRALAKRRRVRMRVSAILGVVAVELVVLQCPGLFATVWTLAVSARAGSVVCRIYRQSRALRFVEQGTGDTSQVVAVLDPHRPLVVAPASDLSQTVLPGMDLLAQLMHLPPQIIKLGQLGIDVRLFVVVVVGLVV